MRDKLSLKGALTRKQFWLDNVMYLIVLAAIIALACKSPFFLTKNNLISALKSAMPILMVSIGLTFVLISGQLDLSVGSIMLFSASVSALLMKNNGLPPLLGCLLCAALGLLCGMLNGLFIVKLDLNPWLVTLAMQLLLKGVAFTMTKATSIGLPDVLGDLRKIKIGSLPVYVLVGFAIALIMQVVLKRTSFGRGVSATGSNRPAAVRIGLNVPKIRFCVFAMAGLFSGLGALMAFINLGSVTQSCGSGYEFLGVTMIVIGGTSMSGGSGSVFPATVLGVLVITLLENGLSIVGVDPYYFGILRGAIIFLAVYLDSLKNRNAI